MASRILKCDFLRLKCDLSGRWGGGFSYIPSPADLLPACWQTWKCLPDLYILMSVLFLYFLWINPSCANYSCVQICQGSKYSHYSEKSYNDPNFPSLANFSKQRICVCKVFAFPRLTVGHSSPEIKLSLTELSYLPRIGNCCYLLRMGGAVSYTHLTLPTTPYV